MLCPSPCRPPPPAENGSRRPRPETFSQRLVAIIITTVVVHLAAPARCGDPSREKQRNGKMRAVKMFLSLGLGLLLTASAAMAAAPAAKKNPVVVMETTLGTIQIELYPDAAPATVRNFLGYVRAKHYDGLLFHRVIPGFMIQGGGLFADMSEK